MSSYPSRQQVIGTLLLFGLLLLLVPRAGFRDDVNYWVKWASYIFEHGLGNVYQLADNNYNPLYHYILWLFGKLAGSTAKIEFYRHWLKAFTLVFDFAGAFWAASLVAQRERRFGLALLLLFNVGYLYNTLVWVQVDAIYTFFAFGAVVLAVRQRGVGSALLFVLALAAKTQAIIFLPPLLLLWLPGWWQRPARLLLSLVAGAALATLLLAPFIWGAWESYLPRIIAINLGAVNTFPVVSMNAYNLWHLLAPGQLFAPDSLPFAGLTYHVWGLLLFGGAAALALLPLLVRAGRRVLGVGPPSLAELPTPPLSAEAPADLALVLLSCGLLPLVFAFFNTQMHERYWHASILFLAAYAFLRRDYLPYALVSVAYFLNMENLLNFTEVLHFNASVAARLPVVCALLFAAAIGLGFVRLYRLAAGRRPWRHRRSVARSASLAA